ncbi:hypothetical protein [Microbispora sp. CSR-4]|uniref:hypothetical protein n=1 Tax=Microbispora sp. CSR-4 TaxID=2592813 RepID=UPI0011CC060B|nr:hypothetical protein [Microbispora sp. CSR-4]
MNAIYHFMMAMPVLRRAALGTVEAPPEPDRTGHHSFTKVGPGGVLMVLVLDADSRQAVETVTVAGQVTSETITPIGELGLAEWYARRYVDLLADGWHPSTVTPPLDVPTHL